MRFEKSKQLYSYWLNLKGTRQAPDRSEIEPSDIRTLLGDTFILEINHAAKYVIYRLAGTRLCAAYGRELKGLGYLVHWREENNLDILRTITDVYSNFTPSVISYHGQTEQNRSMEYETLLLPLQPIKDGSTRILGISSPNKIAFWNGAEPIVSHKLRSIRNIEGNEGGFAHDNPILTPPLQHDNNELDMTSGDRVKRKSGHLTLLHGGKS